MLGFRQCTHIYTDSEVSKTQLSCSCVIPELNLTFRTTNAFVLGLKTVDEKFAVFYDVIIRSYWLYVRMNGCYQKTSTYFKNLHAYYKNVFFTKNSIQIVDDSGELVRVLKTSSGIFPCENTFLREATTDENIKFDAKYLCLDFNDTTTERSIEESFFPVQKTTRIFVTHNLILDFQDISATPREYNLEMCLQFLDFLPKPALPVVMSKFSRFNPNSEISILTRTNMKQILETCATSGTDLAIPLKYLQSIDIETFDIDTQFTSAQTSPAFTKIASRSCILPSWTHNAHVFINRQETKISREAWYLAQGKKFLDSGLSLDLTGINPMSYILLPGSAVYRKQPRNIR